MSGLSRGPRYDPRGRARDLPAGQRAQRARLDRLARSTRDLLDVAEQLKEAGADLRSLGEPWADTTSPAGRMVLTVSPVSGKLPPK